MMPGEFFNDYDVTFDFGKNKDKKIKDVPPSYVDWVINCYKKESPAVSAIRRIRNRKSVTNLIKTSIVDAFQGIMPPMTEADSKIAPIMRDGDLDPSLFGSFVEYMVKNHMGLSITEQPQELLCLYGLAEPPGNLVFTGEPSNPTKRIEWIHKSFEKEKRSLTDICNLSFSHSILLGHFNEKKASELFTWVKNNEDYLHNYLMGLDLSIPDKDEQYTCDKISVGCVIGVIDMINGDTIIDIKCRKDDNLKEYQRQLFTYACLHYLRYGKIFKKCEIYNFLSGKRFVMELSDSCVRYAREYIKKLGSSCPEHLELFI